MARWLLLLLLTTAPAAACSCGGSPSAKDAWQKSPLVFLGRVERIEPDYGSNEVLNKDSAQTAWVRVEEAFKGVKLDQSLVLSQGSDSCLMKFRPGGRFVFYLHPGPQPGTWVAYGCHRTRSVAWANDDLRFLHALPRSAEGTRISGTVELYERFATEGFRKAKTLPGLRITIKSDSKEVDTFTDADGFYEVYGLAPGKYTVDIAIPRGLKLYIPTISSPRKRINSPKEIQVELGATSGVSVDLVLQVDSRISGRVLSARGEPMEKVCLEAEPAGVVESHPFQIMDCTSQGGRYTLQDMPAGQYRIAVNRTGQITANQPFSTVYYPGVSDPADAIMVTISDGEHVTLADLRTPEPAKTIVFAGQLKFNDDVPLAGQVIKFAAIDGTYSEETVTGPDGTYSLKVLAGKPGTLSGSITVFRSAQEKCPQFGSVMNEKGGLLQFQTPSWATAGDAGQSGILLTFPFRSCEHWPEK